MKTFEIMCDITHHLRIKVDAENEDEAENKIAEGYEFLDYVYRSDDEIDIFETREAEE